MADERERGEKDTQTPHVSDANSHPKVTHMNDRQIASERDFFSLYNDGLLVDFR